MRFDPPPSATTPRGDGAAGGETAVVRPADASDGSGSVSFIPTRMRRGSLSAVFARRISSIFAASPYASLAMRYSVSPERTTYVRGHDAPGVPDATPESPAGERAPRVIVVTASGGVSAPIAGPAVRDKVGGESPGVGSGRVASRRASDALVRSGVPGNCPVTAGGNATRPFGDEAPDGVVRSVEARAGVEPGREGVRVIGAGVGRGDVRYGRGTAGDGVPGAAPPAVRSVADRSARCADFAPAAPSIGEGIASFSDVTAGVS